MHALRRGITINGFIVRRERQNYGLSRSYEGVLAEDPIVVVDDTFNSGSSAEKIRLVLAEEKRSIRDLFVVIDFLNLRGGDRIIRNGVSFASLFTISNFGLNPPESRPIPVQSKFSPAWQCLSSGGDFFYIAQGSKPALDHDRLYVCGGGGTIWALAKATGVPDWQFAAGGSALTQIRSSPSAHDRRIYFGTNRGNVHCVAAGSGKEVWRFGGADWIELSLSLPLI